MGWLKFQTAEIADDLHRFDNIDKSLGVDLFNDFAQIGDFIAGGHGHQHILGLLREGALGFDDGHPAGQL